MITLTLQLTDSEVATIVNSLVSTRREGLAVKFYNEWKFNRDVENSLKEPEEQNHKPLAIVGRLIIDGTYHVVAESNTSIRATTLENIV